MEDNRMVRWWLVAPLWVLPIVSVASVAKHVERFGYEHIKLDIGAGTTNEEWLDNVSVTTLGLGGNYLISKNWLFNVNYLAQFFHPDDFTLRVDRLMFGGGYRYGVSEQFDLFGVYGLGAIKAKATDDYTDRTISSESELIQSVTLGVNYLFSEKLMVLGQVHINRSDIVDENNYKIAFNYQWHPVIGTGLYYQFRDTDFQGAQSDHVNEVGLGLKFVY